MFYNECINYQGICGMAFGLLVSALCDNEQVRVSDNNSMTILTIFSLGCHSVVTWQLLSQPPVVWHYLASGRDARLSQVNLLLKLVKPHSKF